MNSIDGGNHRCSTINVANAPRCDSNTEHRNHTCYSLRIAVKHVSASTSASTQQQVVNNSTQFTKNRYKQHKVNIQTGVRHRKFQKTRVCVNRSPPREHSTTTELLLKKLQKNTTSWLMLKNNTAKITLSKRGR